MTAAAHHRAAHDGPVPTLLPEDLAAVEATGTLAEIVAAHPTWPSGWAALAQGAFDDEEMVLAYAFARTGYHRGLDALRGAGWRGTGPVPLDHEPNAAWLRCVALLARSATATAIGETDEAARGVQLLRDCDERAITLVDPEFFGEDAVTGPLGHRHPDY